MKGEIYEVLRYLPTIKQDDFFFNEDEYNFFPDKKISSFEAGLNFPTR